ncbi:MAG: sporulation protein YunB [Epulopiscium sp. Nele67-Bin005]|nr:MAG: sporulation protein YunB [Epulopiscium sp. Nele67-Bin005]
MLNKRNNRYASYPKNTNGERDLTIPKLQGLFTILLIIAIVGVIYIQLDEQITPAVIEMAKLETTTLATKVINEAVSQTLSNSPITIEDLLNYDYNDDGKLISWNVNSILINQICGDIVDKCTKELKNMGPIPFTIPLGNLTGSRIFANLGPNIEVTVLPAGTVYVDYESDVHSTGINQVNHRVWLNIVATIQIIDPPIEGTTIVSRKIMLIDKVISGDVPPSYVSVPTDSIWDLPMDLSPSF